MNHTIRQRHAIEAYEGTARHNFRSAQNERFHAAPARRIDKPQEDTSWGVWLLTLISALIVVVAITQFDAKAKNDQRVRDEQHACQVQGMDYYMIEQGGRDWALCKGMGS